MLNSWPILIPTLLVGMVLGALLHRWFAAWFLRRKVRWALDRVVFNRYAEPRRDR
jgi:hypothetical protein